MNENIENLIELQKLDIRIKALADFLAALPGKEAELAEERQAAADEVAANQAGLENAKKELRRRERALEDGEERLKQTQVKLNQVKTNKEYEAASRELSEQKEKNGRLEEEILESYDQVEAAEAARKELEAGWKTRDREFQEREKALAGQAARTRKELTEKQGLRDELAGKVKPDSLTYYEKFKAARGQGLARADKEVCLGCNCHVPAQLYNRVLKAEEFISCPHCQRILVHLETELEAGLTEIEP